MFRNILLRSGKEPHQLINPFVAHGTSNIGYYGGNVGNVLFADSVYKTLNTPKTNITVDKYLVERPGFANEDIDIINNQYDVFVAPYANLFREPWVKILERLNQVLPKFKIPIVMVSGGLQMKSDQKFEDLSQNLRDQVYQFGKTLLNSGASSIGVRGEKTKDFLVFLGLPESQIDIIGCPSMYYNGANLQIEKEKDSITKDSSIAMNVNFEAPEITDLLNYHFEYFSNFSYISQIHEEYTLILYGHPFFNHPHQGMVNNVNHPLYTANKIGFPIESQGWINYMKKQDFIFGTRLHGCVAGFLANKPTCIFRYDSRTSELINVHKFPFVEVDKNKPVFDADELYQKVDFSEFNKAVTGNFQNYLNFLEKNQLSHIYQTNNENEEYQRTLENAKYYEMVFPSIIKNPDVVRSGLAFLHNNNKDDFHRHPDEGIINGFKLQAKRDLGYHDFYVETRQQIRHLTDEVNMLKEELKSRQINSKKKGFWR